MHNRANNPFVGAQAGLRPRGAGFTLLEVLTALGILALASSSVLVVIDRCVTSAADSGLRMEAFQLVRENMEQVLTRDAIEESVEYGTSETYADISWETVIEAFPDPVNGEMWVRAVCSAEYTDPSGEKQTVELEHWITELTDQQAGQLLSDEEMAKLEAEQVLVTAEDAAKYAGINVDTLEQWVEGGLVTTADGGYIKYNLDLFVQAKGDPTPEDKARQVESVQELAMTLRTMQKELEGGTGEEGSAGQSSGESEKLDINKIMDLLKKKQE
jgi:prepilin-type N-terminal cleavage/methylation domain-containing protein